MEPLLKIQEDKFTADIEKDFLFDLIEKDLVSHIIKNKDIAESYKNYFNALWRIAKK